MNKPQVYPKLPEAQERVMRFLREHGPAPFTTIAKETDLRNRTTWWRLCADGCVMEAPEDQDHGPFPVRYAATEKGLRRLRMTLGEDPMPVKHPGRAMVQHRVLRAGE